MTYLTSTGETFVEQPGAQLSIDAWGLDTITRKYRGKEANVPDFIASIRKNRNKPDYLYPALTLTNYTINHGRAWAEVDITYKGTFDGKLPDPVYSGGVSTLNVQLELQDTGLRNLAIAYGIQYTAPTTQLTYKAPFVNVRYVLREPPKKAMFEDDLNKLDPVISVVNQTGARGGIEIVPLGQPRVQNIPIIAGLPTPTALPPKENLFNGIANVVTEGPSYTQEGKFYLCEEKNQLTIMPFDFAALLWNLNLSQVTTAPPQNIP